MAGGADLVVSEPPTLTVTPTVVAPGGLVQLPSWTVQNQGTVASNAFSNGFYLSTDATITATDRLLTGNSNTALAVFQADDGMPPTPVTGVQTCALTIFIGILVDRTNTTPESN